MRHAVVLAGGSGTRLWPLSRSEEPKQLIPLEAGKSLLELALERLEGVVSQERRYVCAGESLRALVGSRLPAIPPEQYLGEPEGRDTLAAIGLSASVACSRDPEAILGVFTSDQVIRPVERFREIVEAGYELAGSNPRSIVTFGIAPTYPATGYGYLELAESLGGSARRVSRFREKPDAETAARFVAAGTDRYLWNSGMFVFRARTALDKLRDYEPELAEALARIAAVWGSPEGKALLQKLYPTLRKVSFDIGFMEPASADPSVRIEALPMSLEWIDVGSWPAFASVFPRDEHGNVATPADRVLLLDCSGSLAVSDDPGHVVALLGCEELVVVHTARATLVCPKDRSQEVKKLSAEVAARFGAGFV